MESACGHLPLADFDNLELSNMNRLRAAVHHVGLPKTIVRARQILELDPHMSISLVHEGLTPENVDRFLEEDPPVNILTHECDSIPMKFLLREDARAHAVLTLRPSARTPRWRKRFVRLAGQRATRQRSSCLAVPESGLPGQRPRCIRPRKGLASGRPAQHTMQAAGD